MSDTTNIPTNTDLFEQGPAITSNTILVPKRKTGKQFTVNASKKTTRIASYVNPKNSFKLANILPLDSMGGEKGDDTPRPEMNRTRSNISLRTTNNTLLRPNQPIKANSTTNINYRRDRRSKRLTDFDLDGQSGKESLSKVTMKSNILEHDTIKGDDNDDEYEDTSIDEEVDIDEKGNNVDDFEEVNNKKYGNDHPIETLQSGDKTTDILNDNNDTSNTNDLFSNNNQIEEIRHQINDVNISNTDTIDNIRRFDNNVQLEPNDGHAKVVSDTTLHIRNGDFKPVENSLNMYRIDSVLSQSTGKEKQLPDSQHFKVHDKTSNIGKKQELTTYEKKHSDTNTTTETSSPNSEISTNTGQDSLIFQQSGLTLYNMNTQPSVKNLHSNQGMSNMNRTFSQQSLKRQESYLSFKAPENLQNKFQATMFQNNNNPQVSQPQGASQSQHAMGMNSKNDLAKEFSQKQQTAEQSQTKSLLSQQAQEQTATQMTRKQNGSNPPSEILDLDLSSYLSTQTPKIETRTQQKLWLQRENVTTLNISEEGNDQIPSHIINQNSRFQYEQFSREFLHIRRYTNPIYDSLQRVTDEKNLSNITVNIDKKASDVLGSPKATSKSIAKSMIKGSRPLAENSVSKSIGISLKDKELPEESFQGNIDGYHDVLCSLWKKNVADFKTQAPTKPRGSANSSSTDTQKGPTLSSRYGYQPNPSTQQLPAAFARGNHTTFGQPNGSNHILFQGNNINHFGGMNGMLNQPTTRAQQQQQQQQQQKQFQQQQQYQQEQYQQQQFQPQH